MNNSDLHKPTKAKSQNWRGEWLLMNSRVESRTVILMVWVQNLRVDDRRKGSLKNGTLQIRERIYGIASDFPSMEIISEQEPVQEIAWPEGTCYGCGPANTDGLQLKSYLSEDGDGLVATYDADKRFNSGVSNVAFGGLIASLIDCHSMWTAIVFAHLDEERPLNDGFIPYVTAQLEVTYQEPTPLDQPINLQSSIEGDVGRKTRVTCEVGPEDRITAVGDVLAARMNGN